VSETSHESAPPAHDESPADQLVPPAELTRTPRELTPRARRRSWNELPVRIWLILAIAVAFITAYFTVTKYLSGRHERWLITQGLAVNAELNRIQGTRDVNQQFKRTDRLFVELNYEVPGQPKLMYVPGWLSQLPDVRPPPLVRVGEFIPIRVDPNDPKVWTDRTEPLPWIAEFTIVVLLLPLLALLVLVALLRRRQVINVWRRGEAAAAVVVDHKQSATAPFSRVIRFTFADGRDRRVWATLHPAKGAPAAGETMWVVYPPGNPGRAVVASLYQ
jgi:hypothetical protein